MRKKGYLCIGLVCLFYWFLDSVWSYVSFEYNLKKLIFSTPASYLDPFLLKVPPYQIVSRLMVIALFIILGGIIIEFFIRRQIAEKQRSEAHDTLLTILNSIDATVYVSDMENYEILFMNQYMIDAFGQDSTGQRCHEVFRSNVNVCDRCPNDKLLDASGHPKGVVIWEGRNPITKAWYINYDRAIHWIDGRMVHLQIATDITQLKELQQKQDKAEAQLRQAQKMESIGNLAGGIAHDFNNILSSVLGFTELSLDDVQKNSPMEKNLHEIYAAGKRAKDLVRQILAFARQSDEARKPIQLKKIAKEVIAFLRSSIPTTIHIECHFNSESLILANATQIHQMLMNLCTNAAQAMEEEGGTLGITLEDIDIDAKGNHPVSELTPGPYIELSVSDSGTGIPSDIIGSIFEPYFTTKGLAEGTGMGLAMVHGIIKSYGGIISVESTLGQGSTFTAYLPITGEPIHQHDHHTLELPRGTERILLVDDEPAIAEMGGRILERLGYAVTIRTSSIEALELFRAKSDDFDLVITDMTMPHMTGDKLAISLMRIRNDIPIILCTGYSKKISSDTAAMMGIKAFAYKPVVKADLANTVRRVLDESGQKEFSHKEHKHV